MGCGGQQTEHVQDVACCSQQHICWCNIVASYSETKAHADNILLQHLLHVAIVNTPVTI